MTAPRQYGQVIVLHAAWLTASRRLALWAEDGNRTRTAPARRSRPARRTQSHPLALDPDRLRLAVAEMAGIAAADLLGEEHVNLTLQLPVADGGPIGSAPDDEPPAGAPGGPQRPRPPRRTSRRGQHRGTSSDPSAAAKFLSTLTSVRGGDQSFTDTNPSGVVLGSDIRFAAQAVGMVVELLARGRLLPDLEFVADRWRACWRPLIDGRDRGRIEALVWALPASFVAVRVADVEPERLARRAGTRTQRRGPALADVGDDGRSGPGPGQPGHAERPGRGGPRRTSSMPG